MILNLINYAMLFIGTPYGWGKDGGGQFDCSGFIQEVLSSEGIDPRGDQTAQTLHDILKNEFKQYDFVKFDPNPIKIGSILFFGSSKGKIWHVAMAIDSKRMIEAGGGTSKTLSKEDAANHGAMVRIRQIANRRDLISIIEL